MAEAFKYITTYGLSMLVIACLIIAFIGLLKVCKVFSKISSVNVKKVLYYVLDIALSFAFVAVYFAITKQSFSTYLAYTGAEIFVVTTLYAVYENFGLRKLLQVIITAIQNHIAKNKNSKLTKIVQQLGIEQSLVEIQKLINAAQQEQQEHKNE